MGRHTNTASCSTSQKPTKTCHRRSARPAASLLAALVVLDSIGSSVTVEASPVPLPFLDFLYPSFSSHPSPTNKPNRTPTGASRSPPARPGPAIADETSNERSLANINSNNLKFQQPRLQKRQRGAGIRVAVKYEEKDEGWVQASSWNLHGRGGGAESADTGDAPGLENLQNLDAVNPFTGEIVATEHLDLPVGWQQDRLNRHENYSPIIVTVFAVVLVCSIVLTIGLCRWRNRKLRRLRDLERLERKAKYGEDLDDSGSSQGDSESSNEKTAEAASKRQKTRRIISGKSSAIRRSLAARFRRKNKSRPPLEESKDVDEDVTDTTRAVPSDTPSAAAPLSDEQISSARSQTDEPVITPTISRSTSRNRPPSSRRSISAQPESQNSTNTTPPDPPNPDLTLPPAYIMTRRSTHATQEGKLPLPGHEEDYDPRDLTGYVRSPNPAIRSTVNQTLSATVPVEDDVTAEDTQPPAPPFEGSAMATTSRVAAGATRQAHVATDDKRVLERMRNMAGAPTLPPSVSTTVLSSTQAEHIARAPTWDDIDDWHTEQQAEQHGVSGNVAEGQSASDISTLMGPPLSVGLSLPPPSTLPSSPRLYGDVTDLRLGQVWTRVDGETARELTASAPEGIPELPSAPSAPFMEMEDAIEASAPPAWDDEAEDVATAETTSSAVPESGDQSHATSTADAHLTAIDSRLESRPGTSRRSRFSATLDTPTTEGQCLPRYEP
ncbi:hypothetical protein FRB91_009110 [Serendipita sp. 411]|nr:hypothetical protein FRB91_009110 [Serendipita sp. 411]